MNTHDQTGSSSNSEFPSLEQHLALASGAEPSTVQQLIEAHECAEKAIDSLAVAYGEVYQVDETLIRLFMPFAEGHTDFPLQKAHQAQNEAKLQMKVAHAFLAWCEQRGIDDSVMKDVRGEIQSKSDAFDMSMEQARQRQRELERQSRACATWKAFQQMIWLRDRLFQLLLAAEPCDFEAAKAKAGYLSALHSEGAADDGRLVWDRLN